MFHTLCPPYLQVWHLQINQKYLGKEFPVVAQQLTNPTSIHEDVGLTPSLTQWIKDPTLLRAVVWVADAAGIWRCRGCGVGWQLELQFTP